MSNTTSVFSFLPSSLQPRPVLSAVKGAGWLLVNGLVQFTTGYSYPSNVTSLQMDSDREESRPQRARVSDIPGPWAFVTSRFAIWLLILTLVLHRIQHIVVPPRIRRRRSLSDYSLFSLFLPIDTSDTRTRFLFRLPSLYFLLRSLLLIYVILLQVSGFLPSVWPFSNLGQWANTWEFKDVCWTIFKSVSFAIVVGATLNGLDANQGAENPFNLFGYTFLLHIYSSPFTHEKIHDDSMSSRPPKHVAITIMLPLLQLTLTHIMAINKKWSNMRLIPSGICGLLGLGHFIYVVFVSSSTYPIFTFINGALESFLLLAITLTATLHALTQILLEGGITGSLLGHASSLPSIEDDFGVALLKLGTSCLEATRVSGLGNEVAGLSDRAEDDIVVLGRSNAEIRSTGRADGPSGFAREIRAVKVQAVGDRRSLDIFHFNRAQEAWKFALAARDTAVALYREVGKWAGWIEGGGAPRNTWPIERPVPRRSGSARGETNPNPDDLYARFLAGEADEDEDGPDYWPERDMETDDGEESDDGEEESDPSPTGSREDSSLYADLMQPGSSGASSSLAPVVVAHLTSPETLTRRRYSTLLAQPASDTDMDKRWVGFIRDRRERGLAAGQPPEDRHNCVVCTAEPRSVICWPCRCLALCDDCRGNIASRFASSKHVCPCCRQKVEGYSKIFVP